jgi:hypothetical protein
MNNIKNLPIFGHDIDQKSIGRQAESANKELYADNYAQSCVLVIIGAACIQFNRHLF